MKPGKPSYHIFLISCPEPGTSIPNFCSFHLLHCLVVVVLVALLLLLLLSPPTVSMRISVGTIRSVCIPWCIHDALAGGEDWPAHQTPLEHPRGAETMRVKSGMRTSGSGSTANGR
uniref:Uncharacterized protein n=1 Tax=Anopheles coluzzii TaxID=1518534 RepID=A0A8W7PQT9_ANOCL